MLVLLLLLISRLINLSGLRISHSKVFSSEYVFSFSESYLWFRSAVTQLHFWKLNFSISYFSDGELDIDPTQLLGRFMKKYFDQLLDKKVEVIIYNILKILF